MPDEVDALLGSYGAYARPVRATLARLVAGRADLADLVDAAAVPRREVEALLSALGADLTGDPATGYQLPSDRVAAYRQVAVPRPSAEVDHTETLRRLAGLIAAAPPPRRALDHVPATAETLLHRAQWMDAGYELAGRRVLYVGDHDLTSLAQCLLRPDCEATVVDVDERVLEYIDTRATAAGWPVCCLYADLRTGLPAAAAATADLAFTDPPYTPEGVRLFLGRAVAGLRDRAHGRVLLAYGYAGHQPALGLAGQQAAQALHLVFEAILPGFNRYRGGQSVGSASDLYVCRPTARTWRALPAISAQRTAIYTRGAQSVNAARVDQSADVPPAEPSDADPPATVDLADDPGSWLLRALLATNLPRLQLRVPIGHPDLADQAGQQALADLVAPKWRLTYRRGVPDRGRAVVSAVAVPVDELSPPARARRYVLDRAAAKLGNAWREGVIAAARAAGTPVPSKNDVRAAIAASGVPPTWLDTVVAELPRHQLAAALRSVADSADRGDRGAAAGHDDIVS